jgi:hypothetical protein
MMTVELANALPEIQTGCPVYFDKKLVPGGR